MALSCQNELVVCFKRLSIDFYGSWVDVIKFVP